MPEIRFFRAPGSGTEQKRVQLSGTGFRKGQFQSEKRNPLFPARKCKDFLVRGLQTEQEGEESGRKIRCGVFLIAPLPRHPECGEKTEHPLQDGIAVPPGEKTGRKFRPGRKSGGEKRFSPAAGRYGRAGRQERRFPPRFFRRKTRRGGSGIPADKCHGQSFPIRKKLPFEKVETVQKRHGFLRKGFLSSRGRSLSLSSRPGKRIFRRGKERMQKMGKSVIPGESVPSSRTPVKTQFHPSRRNGTRRL